MERIRSQQQIQQWHFDRFVSTIRRLSKDLPVDHLPFELTNEAQKTLRHLVEAGLNPFDHLKLTGEK